MPCFSRRGRLLPVFPIRQDYLKATSHDSLYCSQTQRMPKRTITCPSEELFSMEMLVPWKDRRRVKLNPPLKSSQWNRLNAWKAAGFCPIKRGPLAKIKSFFFQVALVHCMSECCNTISFLFFICYKFCYGFLKLCKSMSNKVWQISRGV